MAIEAAEAFGRALEKSASEAEPMPAIRLPPALTPRAQDLQNLTRIRRVDATEQSPARGRLSCVAALTPTPPAPAETRWLTRSSINAVVEYKGQSYRQINGYLLGKGEEPGLGIIPQRHLAASVARLDAAQRHFRLSGPTTVFRGVLNFAPEPGQVWKNFTSTTTDLREAKKFAGMFADREKNDQKAIFEIEVPAGIGAIDFDASVFKRNYVIDAGATEANTEHELLLERNLRVSEVADQGMDGEYHRYKVKLAAPSHTAAASFQPSLSGARQERLEDVYIDSVRSGLGYGDLGVALSHIVRAGAASEKIHAALAARLTAAFHEGVRGESSAFRQIDGILDATADLNSGNPAVGRALLDSLSKSSPATWPALAHAFSELPKIIGADPVSQQKGRAALAKADVFLANPEAIEKVAQKEHSSTKTVTRRVQDQRDRLAKALNIP